MKINYNNIEFDSDLEVEYYKYLQANNIRFKYQNEYSKTPIKISLGRRKTYTPDFIIYDDKNKKIRIIETKGYAKWSANEDNNIMDFMKYQVAENSVFLISWLKEANLYEEGYSLEYQRIRYNRTFGWVDYNFKNPNTLANKRKQKINDLQSDLKELIKFKKDTLRYFKLSNSSKKLTESQKIFMNDYITKLEEELNGPKEEFK